SIPGTKLAFELPVALGGGESNRVTVAPAPVLENPQLWWPNGYGPQPQYDLDLEFTVGDAISHRQQVRFGVRQITCEMHERNGHYGRRILINGQKIFAR